MKILVVDDFASMRNIVKKMLTDLHFNDFVAASSGNEALVQLQNHKVDMIFTDWNMPDGSGLDLLTAVRADSKLAHIPVIMVTSEAKPELIGRAIKAGADDFIVKPFSQDTIKRKLAKIIRKLNEKGH